MYVCVVGREGGGACVRILGVDLEGSWVLASTALVVIWTAMYLTRYSDYLTGFRESGAERQKNRIDYPQEKIQDTIKRQKANLQN